MRQIQYLDKKGNREDFLEVYFRSDFQEAITKIRQEFDIDPLEFEGDMDYETERKFIALLEDLEIDKRVRGVIEIFKLPSRWVDFLLSTVVDDSSYPSFNLDGNQFIIDTDDKTKEVKFFIEVNEKTSLNDIKKQWPKISESIKKYGNKSRKSRPMKKIMRNYFIYNHAKMGHSILEIMVYMKKEFGEDLDPGNIKKIVSDFKKEFKMKDNFELKT